MLTRSSLLSITAAGAGVSVNEPLLLDVAKDPLVHEIVVRESSVTAALHVLIWYCYHSNINFKKFSQHNNYNMRHVSDIRTIFLETKTTTIMQV